MGIISDIMNFDPGDDPRYIAVECDDGMWRIFDTRANEFKTKLTFGPGLDDVAWGAVRAWNYLDSKDVEAMDAWLELEQE